MAKRLVVGNVFTATNKATNTTKTYIYCGKVLIGNIWRRLIVDVNKAKHSDYSAFLLVEDEWSKHRTIKILDCNLKVNVKTAAELMDVFIKEVM